MSRDPDEIPSLARAEELGLGPRHRTQEENAIHAAWFDEFRVANSFTEQDVRERNRTVRSPYERGCRCNSCRGERRGRE